VVGQRPEGVAHASIGGSAVDRREHSFELQVGLGPVAAGDLDGGTDGPVGRHDRAGLGHRAGIKGTAEQAPEGVAGVGG